MTEPLVECLEQVLARALVTARCEDEAAWHEVWHQHGLGAEPPIRSALMGGALSDRLSWVFISGYQAALRQVFPSLPSTGWAAFAATEAKDDPDFPGTALSPEIAEGGYLLNGHKSWVAQSRHVAHLLVTVRPADLPDAPPSQCVRVDAAAKGVTLSHRSAPGFLASLSQGFARFEDVHVAGSELLGPKSTRAFGRTEPRFVMLAACGFLLAQMSTANTAHQAPGLLARLTAVSAAIAQASVDEQVPPEVMGMLDVAFSECVDAFDKAGLGANVTSWAADARLLRMYSGRIQARAEKARGAAGSK